MQNAHGVTNGRQKLKKETPAKLERFGEFATKMKSLALKGTEKYCGDGNGKENIDIVPEILGEQGYLSFVLGDLLKRVIRFKNQKREDDLAKIALWAYLLWARLFPQNYREGGDGDAVADQGLHPGRN